jgi:hypothetical protein
LEKTQANRNPAHDTLIQLKEMNETISGIQYMIHPSQKKRRRKDVPMNVKCRQPGRRHLTFIGTSFPFRKILCRHPAL